MVSLSRRWWICSSQSVQQATNVTPKLPWDIVRARRRRSSTFIWRTTEVTIQPLSQVGEAFAWDEGKGNRTRDWWLDAHLPLFRPASEP